MNYRPFAKSKKKRKTFDRVLRDRREYSSLIIMSEEKFPFRPSLISSSCCFVLLPQKYGLRFRGKISRRCRVADNHFPHDIYLESYGEIIMESTTCRYFANIRDKGSVAPELLYLDNVLCL